MTAPLLIPLQNFICELGTEPGVWVRDRDDASKFGPMIPRPVQVRIMQAMIRQAKANRPIRIIVLKFRRGGVSNLVQGCFRSLCEQLEGRTATTYAHTDTDTVKIFELAKRIQDHRPKGAPIEENTTRIKFANGSSYNCRTAGGRGVSAGNEIHYMHITELALLQSKVGLDATAINVMVNAVAESPHTIVVKEGTGDGPKGEFYQNCCDARDGKSDYELIFCPWFEDNEYRKPVPDDGLDLPEWMQALQTKFALSDEQMSWYAHMFRSRCGDGKDRARTAKFKSQFPSTFEECFLVSSGQVYPYFTDAPVEKKGNVDSLTIGKNWDRYRVIDWGFTKEHPFVVLWVAHDPTEHPGFVVHPRCENTIRQLQAYVRHAKTGAPVKENDDCPDCVRMVTVTRNLTGLVYVYQEYYEEDPPTPDNVARIIHEMSGWSVPKGIDPALLAASRPGAKGERYVCTVADRAGPGRIKDLNTWGLGPVIPSTPPIKAPGGTSKGEVEDGIERLSALMSRDTQFFAPFKSPAEQVKEKLRQAGTENGRPVSIDLTAEEERILAEDRAEHDPERRQRGTPNPMEEILGAM